MRIAILTAGNSTDTGGIMSFVCEEVRQLKKIEANYNMSFDVFMIRLQYSAILRFFLKIIKRINVDNSNEEGKKISKVDAVEFNNIWIKENLISFIIRTRLSHCPYGFFNTRKITKQLARYAYIIAHKSGSHYIGLQLKERYGISFGAFWHGSELAVQTFSDKNAYALTKKVLEKSDDNFYVSKALLKIGKSIYEGGNNHVIYTGPSDMFYKYSVQEKKSLREEYSLSENDVVIAFVGSLLPVKNVMLLPSIFKSIKKKCPNKQLKFWIIGAGYLENDLRKEIERIDVPVEMKGGIPLSKMPDYMNCIDVLLLISKKEGLGLVCLEAMRCGAQVFGSLIGGIPEVIGEDRCVALDDTFIEKLSDKVSESINEGFDEMNINPLFSWEVAAKTIAAAIES